LNNDISQLKNKLNEANLQIDQMNNSIRQLEVERDERVEEIE